MSLNKVAEPSSHENVGQDLMEALKHLQRAQSKMKETDGIASTEQSKNSKVMSQLEGITATVKRCLAKSQELGGVISGKMECSSCGSNSVEILPNKYDPAKTNTSVKSDKSSAKTSQQVANAGKSNLPILKPLVVEAPIVQKDEIEEEDLVLKSTSTTYTSTSTLMPPSKRQKLDKSQNDENTNSTKNDDVSNFEMLFQKIFESSPEALVTDPALTGFTDLDDNKKENIEQNTFNEMLQLLLANSGYQGLPVETTSDDDTVSTASSSSQHPDTVSTDIIDINSILEQTRQLCEQSDASTTASNPPALKRKSIQPEKCASGAGYKCPHEGCNKIFKERGSVGRHLVTHTGKRFQCDQCSASYTQKNALKIHMQVHSNPDMYKCGVCGFKYGTQNGLRQHMKSDGACIRQKSRNPEMDDMGMDSLNELLQSVIASGGTDMSTP